MALYELNCSKGATDTKNGKCESSQCDHRKEIHRPNHDNGCHFGCTAPGYVPAARDRPDDRKVAKKNPPKGDGAQRAGWR